MDDTGSVDGCWYPMCDALQAWLVKHRPEVWAALEERITVPLGYYVQYGETRCCTCLNVRRHALPHEALIDCDHRPHEDWIAFVTNGKLPPWQVPGF